MMVAVLAMLGSLAGCGTRAPASATSATRAVASAAPPSSTGNGGFPHVLVIMDENSGYAAMLGSCGRGSPNPYLCSLASAYASVTDWFGVEHPSFPDYIDTVSGSDQGCRSDGCPAGTCKMKDEVTQ